MKKIHLLLSGGGFRATLFHLGVLRFLYEHRMVGQALNENGLHQVSMVAGVSGGSLTACHFAANLQRYLGSFTDAAGDLITFCRQTDLRRKVLIDRKSVSEVLDESLFRDAPLLEAITKGLDLVALGTSYKTGDCIAFRRSGISQWRFDPQQAILKQNHEVPDAGIHLSKLIQASAAFPPFFPPLRISSGLFSSQPTIEMLKDLFEDEVADGGIRDNLGLEWYRSAIGFDSDVAVLISNAGQAFDWDATSRLSQGAAIWGQRLLRTTDIQMRRLAQIDFAAGAVHHPGALHVGFADCRNLSASENADLSLWSKSLPRGVAMEISKMSTDLSCTGAAQTYAIIRLGYDLAALRFAELKPEKNAIGEADAFWKRNFPDALVRRLSSNSDKDVESLESHIRSEETPRVQGWVDLWKHVPITRRQSIKFLVLAIVLPVPFIWGCVEIFSHAFNALKSFLVRPEEFSYDKFTKTASELDWESTCMKVEGNYLTVHGKLLERRESTIKIELDGLKKIAIIQIEDQSTVMLLPNTPDESSSDFLVVRGRVMKGASDTYSLAIEGARLLDSFRKRPATW